MDDGDRINLSSYRLFTLVLFHVSNETSAHIVLTILRIILIATS